MYVRSKSSSTKKIKNLHVKFYIRGIKFSVNFAFFEFMFLAYNSSINMLPKLLAKKTTRKKNYIIRWTSVPFYTWNKLHSKLLLYTFNRSWVWRKKKLLLLILTLNLENNRKKSTTTKIQQQWLNFVLVFF